MLHLVNTLLVYLTSSIWLREKRISLLAAALFALLSSHWKTTMWITTQGQLLAMLFILIAVFFFIKYTRKQKRKYLLFSWLAHLAVLFSFTAGIELPLIIFLIFYLEKESEKKGTSSIQFKKAAMIISPFILNVLIYFLLRWLLLGSNIFGVETSSLSFIFKAGKYFGGGLIFGIIRPLTGFTVSPEKISFTAIVLICMAALALVIALIDWKVLYNNNSHKVISILLLWLFISYAMPIPARIDWKWYWFVTNPRYFYLPALPASIMASILLCSLKRAENGFFYFLHRYLLPAAIAFIIFSNAVEILQREKDFSSQTSYLARMCYTYINNLNFILDNAGMKELQIINSPTISQKAKSVGLYVTPRYVAALFLPEEKFSRIKFLEKAEAPNKNENLPLFEVEEGYLVRVQ